MAAGAGGGVATLRDGRPTRRPPQDEGVILTCSDCRIRIGSEMLMTGPRFFANAPGAIRREEAGNDTPDATRSVAATSQRAGWTIQSARERGISMSARNTRQRILDAAQRLIETEGVI